MQTIPTRTDGSWWYELPVELDGATWLFEFAYLEAGGWVVTLKDAAGTVLSSGVRLVTSWPLFRGLVGGPVGALICVDTSGAGTPPGLRELGEGARCFLGYFADGAEPVLGQVASPSTGTPVDVIRGAAGPAGPSGARGLTGPIGATGPAGADGAGLSPEEAYDSIWAGLQARVGFDGVTTITDATGRRFSALRLWSADPVVASAEPFFETPADSAGGRGHLALLLNDGAGTITIPVYAGSALSMSRAAVLAPGAGILFVYSETTGTWHEIMRSAQGHTGDLVVGSDVWHFVDGILTGVELPF